ncbi:uncharacterized small protein (DUF1192 family) [Breoghania corrubedonensis]|uniref:Uncharacterized small protein (DUF1192 family) n=1 Tax=Breoghania corrubedonensis TaxID=665038 RepID=A0A2T5V7D2_9HYPH|nr:DUF1192 domain-containing protein [Breoghania corrubedonensis]PTW59646.1 uncharacterized small protein (DUF1192 family) [Breoghania corrubedonensis]
MALADDETPRIATALHTLGQDLDVLSVEELQERITLLRAEITRLETELEHKSATRSAADALFSR